nr:MAK10-like protein [Tanacetum cinerariifolium]
MENKNPIRTFRAYFKPILEGYRNTIELPDGNNVVPLRSNTIRLLQNGCSFNGLCSEDPNQHLRDFLKLVDSLDLDVANRERTHLKDCKTPQGYPDVLATSRRIALRSMDSFKNDPRAFAKVVKEISLPQDVPSTSDRRLIELENQVQSLMEAHIALIQPTQVNKITSSCEMCSGRHDTLYLMRKSLEVLRKFHWMILEGRFNQLSHVSSPLLSKPGEY